MIKGAPEMFRRVAAVVVLYNPGAEAYHSILSYLDQVELVYVVDNSTTYNHELLLRLQSLENVLYVNCHGNHGIAYALNQAAKLASDQQFEYLLTMDQDTVLPSDYVASLMRVLELVDPSEIQVGIVAPDYASGALEESYEQVLYTMTSGNLLNLAAFHQAGPFLEKLFIDHVDHEYCLRLTQHGFSVLQCNWVKLAHEPGDRIHINFVVKKISFVSHSPLRLYYFSRNGFCVSQMFRNSFPQYRKYFVKALIRELLKTPFEKFTLRRLHLAYLGFMDFRSGKFGPLTQS